MLVLSGNGEGMLDSSRTLAWLANASIELGNKEHTHVSYTHPGVSVDWYSTCDINAAMHVHEVEAKRRIYFDFSSKREMRSCTLIVRSDSILAKQSLNSFLVSFAESSTLRLTSLMDFLVSLMDFLVSFAASSMDFLVSFANATPATRSVPPIAIICLRDTIMNGSSCENTLLVDISRRKLRAAIIVMLLEG